MKYLVVSGIAVFAVVLLCTPCFSQTSSATINGTIRDPSDGAVSGARVTLTNADTGGAITRRSSSGGVYVIVNIPPGNYTLSVIEPGFATAKVTEFGVEVNDTQTHDIKLEIGDVTQTVYVRSDEPLLQQSSSELGTVVDDEAVRSLPLNGRNFSQLLSLTPGATPISTAQGSVGGTSFNAPIALPGSAFTLPAINGQWNRSNMYLLDGVVNHWFFGASWAVLPILESVQEFKVQSHNDKAEYGGVLGGIVNVVSKSGTNDLHGEAWWFLRNDAFDARNPFTDATSKGPTAFRQNQFGAALGGPVLRNRTFFHLSYEGWRYRRAQQQTYFAPTDEELAGDFSKSLLNNVIYDPATTRPDPNNPQGFVRTPFPGNRISAARIDSFALSFIKNYVDRPNATNLNFNVINNRPQISDANTVTLKIDHRVSEKDNVWFRYSRMDAPQDIPTTLKNGQSFEDKPRNVAGGWVRLVGSSLVFDTKLAWVRETRDQDLSTTVGLDPARSDGWLGIDTIGPPDFEFQAPYNGSGINFPRRETDRQWFVSDSASWIKGRHNVRFGGTLVMQRREAVPAWHALSFNNAQTADPANPATTGNSFASALLGLPAQYTTRDQRYVATWPTWGFYAQDEWKLNSRLTANIGLRYDTFNIAKLDPGMNNGFDWKTGDWLIGSGALPGACSELGKAPCIPGQGNLSDIPNGNHIRVNPNPYLYSAPRDGFQPRLGIAWLMLDKTVLRVGYGITFDTFSGLMQTFQQSLGTWPDSQFSQPTYNAVDQPLTTVKEANRLIGNPLPDASPFGSAGWYANPDLKNAYSHQWNVEIQRQLAEDVTFSVAYVASRTFRLDHNGIANAATTPGPGTPAEVRARRPYPYQSTMFYSIYDGRSWYDSLQAKLNKRFSHGFQALASYTWSKALDYQSGWFGAENGIGGGSMLQDWYHPEASKGPAGYNVPHFLSVAAVYDLPFGKGKQMLRTGAAAAILGGWQFNTVAQFRSGQPFNIEVPGDVSNIGNDTAWWNYARPNLVGNPRLPNPTSEQWFNTAAFAAPVLSFGNFGKNVLSTASVQNIDLSLFRRVRVTEKFFAELRIESFNVLNIMNLGAPDITFGSPTFGRVSTLAAGTQPRRLQFALKLYF